MLRRQDAKETNSSYDVRESGKFWKLRRNITSPTFHSNASEKRQEILGRLVPIGNIKILGPNSEYEDSASLIGPDVSRSVISLAMIQLKEKSNTSKPELAVLNDLGCAYAWLGRYSEAKDTLMKAIIQARIQREQAQRNESHFHDKERAKDLIQEAKEAEETAFHNLGIVASLSAD